ncbi:MAG: ATP-binding cassette domain-containing protein, partial [Nitrospinae bacterium]|nr:ATP-binding cassette domain-containing protein [Nitrospinota bacterium]
MREPIVRVENVTVSFDGFKALQGMNFSMDPGELRVVIGPNGAGKTTLLDVITGKVKPVEGRVLFKGSEINGLRVNQIANLGVGRKFQTPGVYMNFTAFENLELSYKTKRGV